jgi:ligand-binding sensor domain-containing protein/signal transduction histidine kinase/DNA-binding response OmpR family regulator
LKTAFFIIILFLLRPGFSTGQAKDSDIENIKLKHFSLEEGLSQSSVLSICQDREGFLWFGTRDGLNKFNGYEFKVYRHNSLDSTSLSNNYIKVIFEDNAGNMWIGTHYGLNLYNREEDVFKPVFQFNKGYGNGINEVWSIVQGQENDLWIGTSSGLYRYNILKNSTIPDPRTGNHQILKSPIRSLAMDENGKIWIKTTMSLVVYNPADGNQVIHTEFSDNPEKSKLKHLSALYFDRSGNLWLGDKNGLSLLNKESNTTEPFRCENKPDLEIRDEVRTILEDYQGNLWVGTYNGIYIINEERTNIVQFIYENYNKNSLSQNSVYKIIEDSKGDIWIGTYAGGVNYFDRSYDSFKLFSPGTKNGLNYKVVSSIIEDGDKGLWIGTEGGGVNYYDKIEKTFRYYRHKEKDLYSLSSDNVKSMLQDSDGNLWIGTHDGGLNFLDFSNPKEKFITFWNNPKDSLSLSNDRVIALFEDIKGKIWIGTSGGGINVIDKSTKKILRLKEASDIISDFVFVFSQAKDKNELYAGGRKGLAKINIETKKVERVTFELHDDLITNNAVISLYEDELENLWVGTDGDGLYKYNLENKGKIKFGTTDGLPSEVVYGILPDDKGNLWLSSNNGLTKFNMKTNQVKNFDVSDGIQGREFNYGAYLKSRNGELMFGGANGLTYFKSNEIIENSFVPPVLITGVKINNKPISGWSNKGITLEYNQNMFSIDYIALSYSKSNKNQYAYFLDGFDEGWNFVEDKKAATYTNIDPGTYTLKVKGSNSDGLWNERGAQLKIRILQPPWKTWWAYIFYFLLLGILFWIARKYYFIRVREKIELRKEREAKEKIEEVNALKLELFTNISHDFRTPLTLIIGPLKRMLYDNVGNAFVRKQHEIMHRNANLLLQLINQFLDFRKTETGNLKLRISNNNIVAFLEEIKLSFTELAKANKINFYLKTPSSKIMLWFDRVKLKEVIYNLLSNAFKYTESGKDIYIQLSLVNRSIIDTELRSTIRIDIIDEGSGIDIEGLDAIFNRFYQMGNNYKNLLGSGIGLALSKRLVELHNGEIEVESNKGKGTCFSVYIPIGLEHFEGDNIQISKLNTENQHILSDSKFPVTINSNLYQEVNTNGNELDITKPTILIVEDNIDVRTYLMDIFYKQYNVLQAANGKEGLSLAKIKKIDLIISDIMMPVMDGIEFCEKIKSNIVTSHIPIILLTAKTSPNSQLSGYKTGADVYITKPFDPQILELRVENLLLSRNNLIEKFRKELILEPKSLAPTSEDEKFLKKAFQIVEENLYNESFTIPEFLDYFPMSRSVLYRKIKSTTGKSISEFIRTIKLKKVSQLIEQRTDLNIADIAYQLGFNDLKHFRKSFKELFGVLPSKYRSNHLAKRKKIDLKFSDSKADISNS